MCMTCLDDPVAFREYIRDRLYQQYAKPDLVRRENDVQTYIDSIDYLIENPDDHDFTDEQMELFMVLKASLIAAETDEEKQIAIDAVKDAMTDLRARGPLRADELRAGPAVRADRGRHPHRSGGVPHRQPPAGADPWHPAPVLLPRVRPEFMAMLFGQEFIDIIGHRMSLYAGGAMKGMEEFATVLLVLDEEQAGRALAQIMTGVYLEAIIAGYYAGAKGQECLMWHTHELGPVGRQDDRPSGGEDARGHRASFWSV